MSIKLRLTAWYSGILAVMLLAFSASIFGFFYINTYGDLQDRLHKQAEQLTLHQVLNSDGSLDLAFDKSVDAQNLFGQMYFYDSSNLIRSLNLKEIDLRFDIPAQQNLQDGEFKDAYYRGYHFLIYQKAVNIEGYDNNPAAVLQMAAYTGEQDKLLDRLKTILITGSFATLIAAFTFGLFLARKAMSPIGKVIEAAEGIQTGNDLSVRIEYDGPPDEIGRLIRTVNSMLGRMEGFYKNLEDSYAAQRRFVSDASHELRTPLTTIRGNIELLQKVWELEPGENPLLDEAAIRQISVESVHDIADEAQRMSRLVADMLSLARADTGRTFEKEPIALEPMMNEVARRAAFLPREAEWTTGDLSGLNGKYVLGNKDYLQQMLFIFIDNAFKYTPSGEVTFDAVVYQHQVGIRVKDTGIGMEKDEVPHIFDRFYRADESRGITEGIGLGLSIAKWIIDEHGGSVEVVTRQGEGTTFVIWLPLLFAAPLE
ncbi:sensor histidine kinase [Paenibacillus durus]|uniref:histidine kinase n=1 Tax=Paenibacillus durus TaxID=44251 RepID=A0A089HLY8_PAEDU|nr:HAMP domain-containing sensor histidine kinase [Paenibacillus durus]AIQ12117.1 histidine kinase [Paenibacillus durus]